MKIIFKEENGKLFGSTNVIGIGKRQPKLIYGEQMKKLREEAGFTIDELATKFRMKPFDIERLEEQKQTLTDKIYEKYKKEFNVEREYFFDLDLETLILNGEGHILKSFNSSDECKKVYEEIMNDYFDAVKNNRPALVVDFSKIERGNE